MAPSHAEEGPAPAAPTSAVSETGPVRVAGITFSVPATWRRETPSSTMRAAQFGIPGGGNEKDGTVAVYYFGRDQGGGVAENVKRWQDQFTGPAGNPVAGPVTAVEKNGLKVTIVTARGTYAPGMSMGQSTPEPGSSLWGAIVEGPQGNVFVKATGPAAVIERSLHDFDNLLDSLRATTSM